MTFLTGVEWPMSVLVHLAYSGLRAIALAGFAGIVLAAFRVKATPARLFAWKAVLCAALAMPLLGWLLPPLHIPAPRFFQRQLLLPAIVKTRVSIVGRTPHPEPRAQHPAEDVSHTPLPAGSLAPAESALPQPSLWSTIQWRDAASLGYFAVTMILLARFVVGVVFTRRLFRTGFDLHEPRITQRLVSGSRAHALNFAPLARESELISVPVTMGVMRPTILLPTSWRDWDDARLEAVLAHEISHVARRDALAQQLSLVHRAIFWFSPLAWWLDRHLANLAEQASDEAALACGTDRNDYARTLLGFFEALHAAPGRVWWQGVAMAKAGQAERRLERILTWKGTVAMGLRKSIALAMIAVAIPVVYLAASARPGLQNAHARENLQTQTPAVPAQPPAPESAPVTPPQSAGPAAGVVSSVGSGPTAAVPATSPAEPAEPSASASAEQREAAASSGRAYSYAYGYDDEQRFVIVSGKSDSFTMSGSSDDARHVERLKKQIPGDFIWFEQDGMSYIIRDQGTIDRARGFWLPQQELGKKQEELGRQQEALGKQQAELGAKMEKVRVNVPEMTAEMDKLRAELKALGSGATAEQISHLQAELGELQARLGESQSRAGVQQSKLGDEMGTLGARQGELGAKQGELGRQQAELAHKAVQQMKELLDQAVKNGTAKPEPPSGDGSML